MCIITVALIKWWVDQQVRSDAVQSMPSHILNALRLRLSLLRHLLAAMMDVSTRQMVIATMAVQALSSLSASLEVIAMIVVSEH